VTSRRLTEPFEDFQVEFDDMTEPLLKITYNEAAQR
jgi:hypothetical protein